MLIVDGQKHIISNLDVKTWHDTGLSFPPQKRPMPPCALTLHWTGSERHGDDGAATVHRSMCENGTSTHFVATNDGGLYQMADVVDRCSHASRVNDFAIGLEISNPGWARSKNAVPLITKNRDRYHSTIHGWRTQWLDFFPAQYRSVEALVLKLIQIGVIKPHVFTAPFERITTRTLQETGGVHGHLHAASFAVKHPKCDPGTRILRNLHDVVTARCGER